MKTVVPRVDLRQHRPPHAATKLLTKQFCERHQVVPVSLSAQGVLVIAMVDPEKRANSVAEIRVLSGMKVEVVQASVDQIRDTITACYGGAS